MEKSITNQFTIDSIDQAVSEKLDKLNDHYHILNRNDLCIIVQEQLNYYVCQEEIIDDLICNTISSIQKFMENKNVHISLTIISFAIS